jgi:F-type H+-transporting ATPase subunit gamma
MRSLNEIAAERDSMKTILELTSAFEGIASMRIAQIKDQVEASEKFFAELWRIYTQIRVDALFHFGRSDKDVIVSPKELMILITSEGSFSGDIDQRLVKQALEHYNKDKNDVVVIGHHGAIILGQHNVPYIKSYKLPTRDKNINVGPLAGEVQKYASTQVYYESYVSLTTQDVKNIQLSAAVAERGQSVAQSEEVINEHNYIFEPSTYEVISHLENSMMKITLSEVILESKLAQYASRFRAMTAAHNRADESFGDLKVSYNRARRQMKDTRLKEVINGLRATEKTE